VCLVEVTRLREEDTRDVDGALVQIVELRPLRGTGATTGGFATVRDTGAGPWRDMVAPEVVRPTPVTFRLPPDSMRLGHRYWAATVNPALQYQGLAGIWPEGDARVAKLFEAAIEDDAYAWHPSTQRNGWALGSFDPPAPAPTVARVWRVKRLMWERPLEGRLTHGIYQAWELLGGNPKDVLHVPGLPDTTMRLLAELSCELGPRNRFGFPPGKAIIKDHLDLWTGRIVASSVRTETVPGLDCFQAYDRRGRVTFERVRERVPIGGRSLGGEREEWLREVERWYDPPMHRIVREEVRASGLLPNSASGWVRVDPDSAYAVAPLKQAHTRKITRR
jgi:hypothetical protein